MPSSIAFSHISGYGIGVENSEVPFLYNAVNFTA
jgi:hypothetical protein